MDTWNRQLLRAIRDQFRCDWDGMHGIRHWYNVKRNAHEINKWMQAHYGVAADPLVIDLFALFHDACRVNEFTDRGHGQRGGELAKKFRGTCFDCTDVQMQLLVDACSRHEYGETSTDPTIGVCWDADRLDLDRVGIWPTERYMSWPRSSIHGCAMKSAIKFTSEIRNRMDRHLPQSNRRRTLAAHAG